MNAVALLCPHCWTVHILPPRLPGEPPRSCPCLDHPPITRAVELVRLRLPQGYEITAKPGEMQK